MKLKTIFAFCVLTLLTGVISATTGIHPGIAFTGLVAIQFVPTPTGVALTAIKVTDLNTKLGAYLREYEDVLVAETLIDQPFDDRVEVWDDVTDEVPLPNLTLTDIVKPGLNKAFQPTVDALSFDARILKVNDAKVDLLIEPHKLHKTWLGMFKKGKGANPFDMPFEEFVMDYIIKKVKENIHLIGLYKGVYNGAGTTTADSMTGFLKQIIDGIALATNPIVPISTGVITQANVKDKLFLVYDGLGEAYKQMPSQMLVNPTIFDWYVRNYNPVGNTSLVSTDAMASASTPTINRFPLFGTNSVLIREAGLAGSQRIICTPKENMVFGTDSISDTATMRLQEFDRSIKLMMDFRLGTQFKQIHSRALAVNEQA